MGNMKARLLKLPSGIVLINTAQAEYDYLRVVDSNPTLYSTPVLKNALYRYETFWLPLAAEFGNDILLAPIDISWIWHCHILNPIAYRSDCIKIVGKVINHTPMFLSTKNWKSCEKLWNKKYPDVPYDIDLCIESPPLLKRGYTQQCSYDIISTAQRQRVFNYNTSLSHFRDEKFLRKAARRYFTKLIIKRDTPDTFVATSYDRDLIWHAHQLHPLLYEQDTKSVLGKILDHDDSINDRSNDSESVINTNNKLNAGVSGAMYRGEPPLSIMHCDDKDTFKEFADRDVKIISRNLKLDLVNLIKVNKSKSFKDIKIILIKETNLNRPKTNFIKLDPVVDNFAISYTFEKGECDMDLQTDDYKYLKIVLELKLPTKSNNEGETYSFLDVVPICTVISAGKSNQPLKIKLTCKTRRETITGSFSFHFSEVLKDYSFMLQSVTRSFMTAYHLSDALHYMKLMAPSEIDKESSYCEYSDHTLVNNFKLKVFSWRVVHSQKPILSAIEILDNRGNVVSTSHSIGNNTLPTKKQVSDMSQNCTHNSKTQRSFLIRGQKGDYAILKAKWYGFRKATREDSAYLGKFYSALFLCAGKLSKWVTIKEKEPRQYEWKIDKDSFGLVDIENGKIRIELNAQNIPETVCLATTIALAFVLCHPRPPPPLREGDEIKRYPPPPANSSSVLPLDEMSFLIASGLYSSKLPRWYHTKSYGNYLLQNNDGTNDPGDDGIDEEFYSGFDNGCGDWRNKEDLYEVRFGGFVGYGGGYSGGGGGS